MRKTHLKINRKVCARSLRKVPWTALDELRTILGRPSGDPRTTLGRPSDDPGRPGTTLGRPSNDIRTKRSASQTIDLIMTINSVQESSKSELSSGTFGHFKVCARPPRKTSAQGCARLFTQDQGRLIFSLKYCISEYFLTGILSAKTVPGQHANHKNLY